MKKQKKSVKEENRELTGHEKDRASAFQKMSEDLRKQGYRQYSLAVGIDRANKLALMMALPVCGLSLILYMLNNQGGGIGFRSLSDTLLFGAGGIGLSLLHELIHGVTWSLFTPDGLKAMEFGITKDTLTPYCVCLKPLKKTGYIIGTLMSLILTGIVPALAGILIGNFPLMLIGAVMIISAAGDILIVFTLLKHKSEKSDQIICDLPGHAGCMLFER